MATQQENMDFCFQLKSIGTFFKTFFLKYRYFTSFCKTSDTVTLLCSSKLYCKTSQYNISAEFSLPHPK